MLSPDPRSPAAPGSWYRRTRALAVELVRTPSVTGTFFETAFGPFLRDLIAQHPYFAARPENLKLEPTLDDQLERFTVFALARGRGPRTVLVTGHYDVVSTANYGPLEPWAFSPEELLPRLVADLRRFGRGDAEGLALADLESGEFLAGRAMLDMKSGLAAGLAVLERFAELGEEEREGNLLLVAVPDEEDASHGMRSAIEQLPGLAAGWGLSLEAAVNLDAETDLGDGSRGRAVFLGSVGKLLPSVLLIGRPTHAGAPFDGLSATLAAAELARLVELNPDLADPGREEPGLPHEPGVPPVLLQSLDLKERYDVTTPEMVWCAFNILTQTMSPAAVLERFKRAAAEALGAAVALTRERAAAQARRLPSGEGWAGASLDLAPRVLGFAEVRALALERGGPAALERLDALAAGLAADVELDTPAVCRRLTEATVREAGLVGPAAVVGFASLYYPPAGLERASPGGARLFESVSRAASSLAAETGRSLVLRPCLPGISDASFLGGRDAPGSLQAMAANTPAWGSRLHFDYAGAASRAIPTVNAGPWGRDYHQRTERVHAPYAFGVLPELVWRIVRGVLG